MSVSDIQLLLTALGGVALLVALIVTRIRLHPLIALLVVSLVVGIAAGMDIGSIAGATVAGAGHTLGVVGIVIALGATLASYIAATPPRFHLNIWRATNFRRETGASGSGSGGT